MRKELKKYNDKEIDNYLEKLTKLRSKLSAYYIWIDKSEVNELKTIFKSLGYLYRYHEAKYSTLYYVRTGYDLGAKELNIGHAPWIRDKEEFNKVSSNMTNLSEIKAIIKFYLSKKEFNLFTKVNAHVRYEEEYGEESATDFNQRLQASMSSKENFIDYFSCVGTYSNDNQVVSEHTRNLTQVLPNKIILTPKRGRTTLIYGNGKSRKVVRATLKNGETYDKTIGLLIALLKAELGNKEAGPFIDAAYSHKTITMVKAYLRGVISKSLNNKGVSLYQINKLIEAVETVVGKKNLEFNIDNIKYIVELRNK